MILRYYQRTSSDVAVAIVVPVVVDVGKTAVVTVTAVKTVGVLKAVSSHPCHRKLIAQFSEIRMMRIIF